MAFVETLPHDRELLGRCGLISAGDFLALPGVILSGHPTRHVLRIELGGTSFILKKEHRVPWRDRFASSWHGLGWSSKSVREAHVLWALHAAGVPCPAVAAFGEDGDRAFLLLREATGFVDLRVLLAQSLTGDDRRGLADALGRELARLHAAGFDQPDLYAKHVLVRRDADGLRFCFLDWQRSRPMRRVPWRRRLHDLAALDASLADELAGDRLRWRCLRSYLHEAAALSRPAVGCVERTLRGVTPSRVRSTHPAGPLRRIAETVRRMTTKLLARRKIRELRQPPGEPQQLLWPLGDERLCATPEFYAAVNRTLPTWLLPKPHATDCVVRRTVALPGGRVGCFVRRWGKRSGSRAPEVAVAATLFRLQRFGVRAPRLLAFGQCDVTPNQRYSFLLTESPGSATPVCFREAGRMLRRIHEAGFCIRAGGPPHAAVADIDRLERTNLPVEALARLDLPRFAASGTIGISRTDRLRFLRGYLDGGRFGQDLRGLLAMLHGWERRAAR